MKMIKSVALGGALVLLSFTGCDRYGQVVDLDGRRPETLDGTLHVSWDIDRLPAYEAIKCDKAGAEYVLVTVTTEGRRTYRMPCELMAKGAWIPVKRGDANVRAELVGFDDRSLSHTKEVLLRVSSSADQLDVPFVFGVK